MRLSSSVVPPPRTKIICTIGPASSSVSTLRQMIKAGMSIARINFSHGIYETNLQLIERIRQAAKAEKQPVGLMQDLQGPRLRIGTLPPTGVELTEGATVMLGAGLMESRDDLIPIPYDRLAHDVGPGDRILIDDGTLELEVMGTSARRIEARVLLGGTLRSHKGINVPTVSLSVDAVTEKDEQDVLFGIKQQVDFIALSFVRTAEDVEHLRARIWHAVKDHGTAPMVIVKIEKHEALEHIDDIIMVADGIMIARGDLGLETPVSRLPLQQKEIIKKCIVHAKPVITATQMLGSMEFKPRPTRAEVSDVANAIIDHTDATMLSGETAMGRYPVRSVQMMAQIIRDVESSPMDDLFTHRDAMGQGIPFAIAAAAVEIARHVSAAAILVTTRSGYSASAVSRFRPAIPVFAMTPDFSVHQHLLLNWGITPIFDEDIRDYEAMTKHALTLLRGKYKLPKGSRIVVVSGLKRENKGYDSSVHVVEI